MDAVTSPEWVELESQGFSAYVGPIFRRNGSDGLMLYKLDPKEHHRNRRGVVHGGAIMTLGDIVT